MTANLGVANLSIKVRPLCISGLLTVPLELSLLNRATSPAKIQDLHIDAWLL